jgi:hypothetical protein
MVSIRILSVSTFLEGDSEIIQFIEVQRLLEQLIDEITNNFAISVLYVECN